MADNNVAIPQSLVDFIERNKINLDDVTDDQLRNGVKIANAAVKYKLNPDFPLTMAWQESAFKSDAKNKKSSAYGPMQLIDATATGLGVDSKDVDQNIDGGMRLIKELMANSRIGNDSNKVLAGYHSGPSSKFIDTGDFNDLTDTEAQHFKAVLGYSGGNELPLLSLDRPTPQQAESEGSPITGPAAGEHTLSPEALSLLGGGTGLAVGAGITGAEKTAQLAKFVYGKVFSGGAPPQSIAGRVAPILDALPTPAGNTPGQTARILSGGKGDLDISGRARQEGYNFQTSQAAAAKKTAEEAAELAKRAGITELSARQYLATQPGMTSSPAGILYPREAPRPTVGARTYSTAPTQRNVASVGPDVFQKTLTPSSSGQSYTVGGAQLKPAAPLASVVPPTLPKESILGPSKTYAQSIASVLKPVAKIGLAGLSGALGANELYKAEKDREKNGLTFNNSLDYLAGVGGVAGMVPTLPTQLLSAAAQVPATVRDLKSYVENNPKQMQRLIEMGVFDSPPGQP